MFGLSLDNIINIKGCFGKIPEIEKVILYGSRAKGNYKNGSDIDMTLLGKNLTLENSVYPLMDLLDDLYLPYKFDISIFSQLDNTNFIKHILRVGKSFYLKENNTLAKGWEVKNLGELGNLFSGNSINAKVKEENYQGINFGCPYIATKDISYSSKIDYDNGIKIPENDIKLFRVAPKNTVLICAEGGSAGRKVGITNQKICFVNKLFALVTNKITLPKYIFYYYKSEFFQKSFKSNLTGLIGGVSKSNFKQIKIPLPPLPEQQKIVSVLDRTFAAIDKMEASLNKNISNAKELFQSKLNDIFTEQGKNWEVKNLGEVCEVKNGGTPKTNFKEYWNGDIAWITPADLGKLEKREVKETSRNITKQGLKKSSAKLLPKKSVILSTRAPIGHLAINEISMATNQGCRGIIPNYNLNEIFLYYFLKLNVDLLNELGAGATFKELSSINLKQIKIPLPPLKEQKQIVSVLDKLKEKTGQLEQNYQKKLLNLWELKKVLLEKAFKGKLICQR